MTAVETCRITSPGDRSEPTRLRAGPLTTLFVDGDLRRVGLGGREVVRRLYGAVRDRNWGTVPGETRELRIEDSGSDLQGSIKLLACRSIQALHPF